MSPLQESVPRHRLTRTAFVVICVSFLLGLLCAGKRYRERSAAEALINVVSRLEVGATNQDDARSATKQFGRYEFNGHKEEEDSFGFQNGPDWLSGVFPSKTVALHLRYSGNVLVQKEFSYTESSGISGLLSEEVQGGSDGAALARFRNQGRIFSVNRGAPPYQAQVPSQIAVVVDDSSVSPQRRAMDWRIDLSCMTKVQPCRDLRSVLTGAFEETH